MNFYKSNPLALILFFAIALLTTTSCVPDSKSNENKNETEKEEDSTSSDENTFYKPIQVRVLDFYDANGSFVKRDLKPDANLIPITTDRGGRYGGASRFYVFVAMEYKGAKYVQRFNYQNFQQYILREAPTSWDFDLTIIQTGYWDDGYPTFKVYFDNEKKVEDGDDADGNY